MLIKRTFRNDTDLNSFFASNPSCYIVKFIVTKDSSGSVEFHLIYSIDKRIIGKEHLQRKQHGRFS